MSRGLVVLHVDGLSRQALVAAVDAGAMPAVGALLEHEGYEAEAWRCGVPSTTPAVQAGILYGDNHDVPGFRWWDREAGMAIGFGPGSKFAQVAHKYFAGARPLCEEGACIAACFPAGAAETFGLTYRDREYEDGSQRGAKSVLLPWLFAGVGLPDMLWHGGQAVAATAVHDVRRRLAGDRPARSYVVSDMLEEVALHHQARHATVQAMRDGYPAIYAGFYAYDETGHAFGPGDPYTQTMLRHVDRTVAAVMAARHGGRREYELVVLSDHGQVETRPYAEVAGAQLADQVARLLPGASVEDLKAGERGRGRDPQLRVKLAHSGGLSHMYFAEFPYRLGAGELDRRFPGLVDRVAALPGIDFALVRDGDTNAAVTAAGRFRFQDRAGDARSLLERHDEADILAGQLDHLNSSRMAGDLVLFAAWDGEPGRPGSRQLDFEEQRGGHGSIGGDQLHPFVLSRRALGLDAGRIHRADLLHEPLWELRRGLV